MVTGNYPFRATTLNADLLYLLSLGSLEAFHSNIFAMIAEALSPISGAGNVSTQTFACNTHHQLVQHRNVYQLVMELLGLAVSKPLPARNEAPVTPECPSDGEYFYLVKREWKKMDLAFFRYTAVAVNGDIELTEETLLGVVEMKIKAMPDPYQLLRYNAILDQQKVGTKALVIRQHPAPVPRSIVYFQKLGCALPFPWSSVYLGGTQKGLGTIGSALPKYGQLVAQYIILLNNLDLLVTDLNRDLTKTTTFDDLNKISVDLQACRMNPVVQKTAYGYLGRLIMEEMTCRLCRRGWQPPVPLQQQIGKTNVFEKDCLRFENNTDGNLDAHVYVDLSHGTGMFGFAWQVYISGAKLRVGIQIQGTDLKMYVSLEGGSLRRISPPKSLTNRTIEKDLMWGHIAPDKTCIAGTHVSPIVVVSSSSNIGGTSYEFAIHHPFNSSIKLKTNAPRKVGTVQPFFHGYSSAKEDFCDLRWDIGSKVSFNDIACFSADYLEWLVFGSTTTCNSPSNTSECSPHDDQKPDTRSASMNSPYGEKDHLPYKGVKDSVFERIAEKVDPEKVDKLPATSTTT